MLSESKFLPNCNSLGSEASLELEKLILLIANISISNLEAVLLLHAAELNNAPALPPCGGLYGNLLDNR